MEKVKEDIKEVPGVEKVNLQIRFARLVCMLIRWE